MLDSTKKTISTLFPPHPREAYRASHLQEERTSREDIEVLCAEAVLSQMGTRCHHRARVRKDFQTEWPCTLGEDTGPWGSHSQFQWNPRTWVKIPVPC